MSVLPSSTLEMSPAPCRCSRRRRRAHETPWRRARYVGHSVTVTLVAAVVGDSGRMASSIRGCPRSILTWCRACRVRRTHVDGQVVAARVLDATQHRDLAPAAAISSILERDGVQTASVGHNARVGGEDAVDGVDPADVGLQGPRPQPRPWCPELPRPRAVVTSWCLADAPGTRRRDGWPSSSADRSRPGVTSMILALPWVPVVMTPACGTGEGPGRARRAIRWPWRPGRWRCAHRGQQHVEFARAGGAVTPAGPVEQVVGGVAHGRDDDNDVITGASGLHDALGDAPDALGVPAPRIAVFLRRGATLFALSSVGLLHIRIGVPHLVSPCRGSVSWRTSPISVEGLLQLCDVLVDLVVDDRRLVVLRRRRGHRGRAGWS